MFLLFPYGEDRKEVSTDTLTNGSARKLIKNEEIFISCFFFFLKHMEICKENENISLWNYTR